jgi:hypothetical protein
MQPFSSDKFVNNAQSSTTASLITSHQHQPRCCTFVIVELLLEHKAPTRKGNVVPRVCLGNQQSSRRESQTYRLLHRSSSAKLCRYSLVCNVQDELVRNCRCSNPYHHDTALSAVSEEHNTSHWCVAKEINDVLPSFMHMACSGNLSLQTPRGT